MAELTIYDSRGNQLGENERRDGDERIKDFFFDGVRFAIDFLQGEAICFFRARDDESSRSEQYYAVYNYANHQELRKLPGEVEHVVENEEGMILDTSQDDTEIFDLLRSSRDPELQYVDMDFRYDIEELLSDGRPIRLGVPSYSEAYAVLFNWIKRDVDRFAIAENATTSNLNSYDVVVDPTGHTSMTALGATERALESLRERRRQQNSPDGTGDENDPRRKAGLAISVLMIVTGVIGLVLIGSCTIAPGTTNAITASSCATVLGSESPDSRLTITSVKPVGENSSNTLAVTGTMDSEANETAREANFSLRTPNHGNETVTKPVYVSSEFETEVSFDSPVENATSLTVEIDGETATHEFDQSDGATPTRTAEPVENESGQTETAKNDSSGGGWLPFDLAA